MKMLKLYENIKNRRLELGLTQSQLAEKMGYADKSMIAKIEKGQVDLTQSKILAFAKALNMEPADLMGWEPDFHLFCDDSSSSEKAYYLDPEVAQMAQALYDRPEMRVLFDASRNASKEDIEAVANILEKMSKE